jgi:nucleoside-diphosphate-sugar epimerase
MTKLIVGCGYLGGRVARLWRAEGHAVVAVSHRAKQAEEEKGDSPHLPERPGATAGLSSSAEDTVGQANRGTQQSSPDGPLIPLLADVTRPETLAALPAAETVLYAVGYNSRSGHSRQELYVDGLRNVLEALPPGTGRIIFISTSGVYGDASGAWVDEDSPCDPTHDAGRALLAAEEVLHRHPLGARGIILRLTGIYGPGRLPSPAVLASAAADSVANLIHVDDAAAVVLAAESRARPPRTYLVSDGHPAGRREYYSYLAELLGLPPLRFCDPPAADVSSSPRRRGRQKLVNNGRMLAELGVQLVYPSYREGLAASVARPEPPRPGE